MSIFFSSSEEKAASPVMVVNRRPLGPQGQGSVSQRDLNTEGAEAAADTIGKEGGYVGRLSTKFEELIDASQVPDCDAAERAVSIEL